jgi:hypothetical protein
VFTARYALSPYIKQIRFVFKGLIITIYVFTRWLNLINKFPTAFLQIHMLQNHMTYNIWCSFRTIINVFKHLSMFKVYISIPQRGNQSRPTLFFATLQVFKMMDKCLTSVSSFDAEHPSWCMYTRYVFQFLTEEISHKQHFSLQRNIYLVYIHQLGCSQSKLSTFCMCGKAYWFTEYCSVICVNTY